MAIVNMIKAENVTRIDNRITLERLDHTKCASDFLRTVKDCIRLGYKDIVVSSNAAVVSASGKADLLQEDSTHKNASINVIRHKTFFIFFLLFIQVK